MGKPSDTVRVVDASDEISDARQRLGSSYWKLFSASTISNLGDGIGTIAYPWLASAVTRNPILIAMVVVVQRLPWLLFTLPAGVITDRSDRRQLMATANWVRAGFTLIVAFVVLRRQDGLPGPDELEAVVETDAFLYGAILVATLLLGMAEVLYDNAAQTIMPSLVRQEHLEKANGRLWSTEMVTNTFIGPPLGAALLVLAFSVPFFLDAVTFAVSAVLITLLPKKPAAAAQGGHWKAQLKEGVSWLWNHDFLRPLAIILGALNAIGMISLAIMVLFAQEVLGTSPTEFALLSTGGAVGGVIGGWTASWISNTIGPGASLAFTILGGALANLVMGLANQWPVVWAMSAVFMLGAVLWNVITVSLRQSIIPDDLLGRVNSVYRFFAWGMIPLGALAGGAIVAGFDGPMSRDMALRMPFFVSAAAHVLLAVFALPKLTTARIEAARESGE